MPHPANVPGEAAVANEIGQRPLIEHGWKNIDGITHDTESGNEILRQYQITHAKRREKYFAERPDVDDPVVGVEPLE